MRGYLKQQFEYGKAEALLERKWPERYNRTGHLAWAGRVYGAAARKGARRPLEDLLRHLGHRPVPVRVPARARASSGSLPLMPEWYLVIALLAGLSLLGILWTPLLLALPLLVAAVGALVVQGRARRRARERRRRRRLAPARATDAADHRPSSTWPSPPRGSTGRLRHGLSPWRRRSAPRLGLPIPRTHSIWSERWRAPDERVRSVESALRRSGGVVFSGGDFERWDLHVRGGMLGSMRHADGRRGARRAAGSCCASAPGRGSRASAPASRSGFAALAAGAALSGAWIVAAVMAAVVAVIVACVVKDCATAAGVLTTALEAEAERHGASSNRRARSPRAADRRRTATGPTRRTSTTAR